MLLSGTWVYVLYAQAVKLLDHKLSNLDLVAYLDMLNIFLNMLNIFLNRFYTMSSNFNYFTCVVICFRWVFYVTISLIML